MTRNEWKRRYVLREDKKRTTIMLVYKYALGKANYAFVSRKIEYKVSVLHKNNKAVYLVASDNDKYTKAFVFCLSGQ